MNTSPLQQEMNAYFTQLEEAEQKSLVLKLKQLLKERFQKNYQADIEEYNKEIDEAMTRVASGAFTTQEELEKEMEAW